MILKIKKGGLKIDLLTASQVLNPPLQPTFPSKLDENFFKNPAKFWGVGLLKFEKYSASWINESHERIQILCQLQFK